jgi:MEKK4 N-terminal
MCLYSYPSVSPSLAADHDDQDHTDHGGYNQLDEDNESPYSSIDFEHPADQLYGSTPPNPRERRRVKDKGRCSKAKLNQMHDLLSHEDNEKKRMNRRRWTLSISGLDGGREANDSDSGLMDTVLKEPITRRKKELRARIGERNAKYSAHNPEERDSHMSGQENDQAVSGAMKVDTRHRFLCLHPNLASKDDASYANHLHVTSTNAALRALARVPSALNIDCPQDRFEFYRNFSALIKLGNTTRKEKEPRLAVGGSPLVLNSFGRQLSSEQEIWTNRLSDLIWLELQAYINLRSTKEQDAWLCERRSKIPADLNRVLSFRANPPAEECLVINSASATLPCYCHKDNIVSGSVCLKQVIRHQCTVLNQATTLLNNIENAESLYPTQRAFCHDHGVYGSSSFQRRIATLCLWITITRDIAHKLRLMAEILGVDRSVVGGAKQWSCIDFGSLDSIIHGGDISEHSCDDETSCEDQEEEESDTIDCNETSSVVYSGNNGITAHRELRRRKSVRFEDDVNDDEEALLDDRSCSEHEVLPSSAKLYTHTVEQSVGYVYRSYIDAALKKNGLRKLRLRLKELLDCTLQRARYALMKPAATDIGVLEVSIFYS